MYGNIMFPFLFIPLLPNLFKWQVNVISYDLCILFWNNVVWMVGYDGRLTVWKYNIWKYKWQKSLQIGNININTIVIYNLKSTKVITNWKYNVTQSLHLINTNKKPYYNTCNNFMCHFSFFSYNNTNKKKIHDNTKHNIINLCLLWCILTLFCILFLAITNPGISCLDLLYIGGSNHKKNPHLLVPYASC